MHFEIYTQQTGGLLSLAQGKWRWRLVAASGEPIASGEGYHNKSDCEHAVHLVIGTDGFTPIIYL